MFFCRRARSGRRAAPCATTTSRACSSRDTSASVSADALSDWLDATININNEGNDPCKYVGSF